MSLTALVFAAGCEDSGTSADQPEGVNQELSALSELAGKTYILDVPSAQWTSPAGLGEGIVKVQPKYAFQVIDIDESTLTFTVLLGTAKNGAQDLCNKTYVIDGALNAEEMTFTLGPIDVQTYFVGPETEAMTICHDFTISGQIVDDGAGLVSGEMSAELDTRDIYPLFYMTNVSSGEALCTEIASWNMSCAECSYEPAASMCLDFIAEDFEVADSPDLILADVPAFDESCLD
jgi:hypothetical protein